MIEAIGSNEISFVNELCVVHLVRACYGLEPFRRFVKAYIEQEAGIGHDLVIVFKGFGADVPEAYRRAARELDYTTVFVKDWGFDLRPYGIVMRSDSHRYFCFLNSFSEPLHKGWLGKMFPHLQENGVGLVGCTGSWESMYSNLFVTGPHNRDSLLHRAWRPLRMQLCRALFPPFPNWHIRTNAFLISRELALELWPRFVLLKRSAYLFENGKSSLSRAILEKGLDIRVVGRDGQVYRKEDWATSCTYRSGGQTNLLVADAQTRRYEEAEPGTRRYLARLAWGEQALPEPG